MAYRKVTPQAAASLLNGYGALAQAKWAAWRRKAGVATMSEEQLDAQMAQVCAVIDPVLTDPDLAALVGGRDRQ